MALYPASVGSHGGSRGQFKEVGVGEAEIGCDDRKVEISCDESRGVGKIMGKKDEYISEETNLMINIELLKLINIQFLKS